MQRVHTGAVRGGLDSFSCAGCHSVGGPDGAGSLTQNALLEGDGEHASSAIERNAPAVLGLGFVELLGHEMTTEPEAKRAAGRLQAVAEGRPLVVSLVTKGVSFGVLRVDPLGAVDTSGVSGVSPDLVVRPFGWKGTESRLRRFVEDAARVHFGIQSTVLAERNRTSPDPARLGSGPLCSIRMETAKRARSRRARSRRAPSILATVESPIMLPRTIRSSASAGPPAARCSTA